MTTFQGSPVWPVPPNWSEALTESLEWLSAVLASPTGSEQRIGQRQTPRRFLEATYTPFGWKRAYFENFIASVGTNDFWMPVWYEIGHLLRPAPISDVTLWLDTDDIDYADTVMLYDPTDITNFDIATISSMDSGKIILGSALTRSWPIDSRVYPVCLHRIEDMQVEPSSYTDNGATARIKMWRDQPNPGTPAILDQYRGYGVIGARLNYREQIQQRRLRMAVDFDGQTGKRLRIDTAGIGFTNQNFLYTERGRSNYSDLIGLLYYLSGRRVPAWLSSGNADFEMVQPLVLADTTIKVAFCGFTDFGGPSVGRQDIIIDLYDGTKLYRRITNASEVGGVETLTIDSAIGRAVTVADVRRISFLSLNRLDQDLVEISHPTDTEGATEATLVFRSTPETRNVV